MKRTNISFLLIPLLILFSCTEEPFDLNRMRNEITGDWYLWIEKDCEGVRYQNLLFAEDDRYKLAFEVDGTVRQKLEYRNDPEDTLNIFYTWDVNSQTEMFFRNNDWEIFNRQDTTMTIRRFFNSEEKDCFESLTLWRYSK